MLRAPSGVDGVTDAMLCRVSKNITAASVKNLTMADGMVVQCAGFGSYTEQTLKFWFHRLCCKIEHAPLKQ